MREFTKQRTVEENWAASAWGEEVADCVLVSGPVNSYSVSHESEIERIIPTAPDDLKAYVRAEILKHRPAGEDEWRGENGHLYRFSVRDGDLGIKRIAPTVGHWAPEKYFAGPLPAAARAWFEKNKPAPKLESNQIQDSDGVPLTLRWFEGQPQWREAGKEWEKWSLGIPSCKAGDAWFRANCPIDRFVMDEGEVLEFRLDENTGEAYCEGWGVTSQIYRSASKVPERYSDLGKAVYRFRDAERAKWTFEWRGKEYIAVRGPEYAHVYEGDWKDNGPPTWVRALAEKMWRERETKWSVRWNATAKPSNAGAVELLEGGQVITTFFNSPKLFPRGCPLDMQEEAVRVWNEHNPKWRTEWDAAHQRTKVMKGDGCYGHIRRDSESQSGPIPPHILAEARAKFRENYVLQPNEIWKRGEVVKLTWDAKGKRVLFGENAWRPASERAAWRTGQHFFDEAERLAAFDKCRAFYYENVEDEALDPDGDHVRFEMRGELGAAMLQRGGVAIWSSHENLLVERWRPLLKKLRAWTDKQLAARKPEKVVFEARIAGWTNPDAPPPNGYHTVTLAVDSVPCGINCVERFRVTIEPAGGE